MNCTESDNRDWIERYLTGALAETDRERLEEHLLACETCQDQLEELALLRASLGEERWSVAEELRGSWLQWHWSWAAAAAAMLVLAVTLWPRLADHPGRGEVEIAGLSAVDAPPYEPRILRSVNGDGEIRFQAAMQDYLEGSYAEAIPGLKDAVELDPELAKAHFYLGACYLLEDEPEKAINSLSRVAEVEDPNIGNGLVSTGPRPTFRPGTSSPHARICPRSCRCRASWKSRHRRFSSRSPTEPNHVDTELAEGAFRGRMRGSLHGCARFT